MRPGTQCGDYGGYRIAKHHYEIRHMPTGVTVATFATWEQVLEKMNLGSACLARIYSERPHPADELTTPMFDTAWDQLSPRERYLIFYAAGVFSTLLVLALTGSFGPINVPDIRSVEVSGNNNVHEQPAQGDQ